MAKNFEVFAYSGTIANAQKFRVQAVDYNAAIDSVKANNPNSTVITKKEFSGQIKDAEKTVRSAKKTYNKKVK